MYNPRGRGKQIGCGYCQFEKTCTMRDPKVNKARECGKFLHYTKQIKKK